jgi:hypothetical protein
MRDARPGSTDAHEGAGKIWQKGGCMRKLSDIEINERCIELAEHIGALEELNMRKATVTAQLRKDIKYHHEIVVRVSQEINSEEIDDTQGALFENSVSTITVDMGKKCRKCGSKGTTGKSGLCMECIAKNISKEA